MRGAFPHRSVSPERLRATVPGGESPSIEANADTELAGTCLQIAGSGNDSVDTPEDIKRTPQRAK